MTVGIATTTFCLVKANKLKNRQTDFVQSIPVLQKDFKVGKHSVLSTNLCSIKDNRMSSSTLGLGLNLNF